MNRSDLSKVVGAGTQLSLAIVPLSLPAQNNAESNAPTLDTTLSKKLG